MASHACLALILALWMHVLKLHEFFPIPDWSKERNTKYVSAACIESAAAFRANVVLFYTMAMVPGYAFMNG
ncbi:MAG: hypothetical protein ABI318_19185, partial [Chthoniobacteraceae bacterium]